MGILGDLLHARAFTEMLNAYTHHDYDVSVKLAVEVFEVLPAPEVLQVFLVSSARLHHGLSHINQRLTTMIPRIEGSEWEISLLKVTTGQSNPSAVIKAAADDEERCQASYYAGARFAVVGQPDLANYSFGAAAHVAADCVEHRLAVMECETRGLTINGRRLSPAREAVDRLNEQCLELFNQRDFTAAMRIARQALAAAERNLGRAYSSSAAAFNAVGAILAITGHGVDSVPYFEQSLAIQRKVFTDKHDDVIGSLEHLADLSTDLGDLERGRRYHEEIVRIRRQWKTSA